MNIITRINLLSKRPFLGKIYCKISEIFWLEQILLLSIDDLLTWQMPDLRQHNLQVTYHEGTEEDVLKINSDSRLGAYNEVDNNLEMIRAGHKLVIARFEEEIVFYAWAVIGRKSAYDKFFMLTSEEFIVARVFTRADFRGNGLYPWGLLYMFPRMIGFGYRRAFVDISSHNKASILASQKVGFQMIDAAYFRLRLFFRDYLIPTKKLKYRFVKKRHRLERV